MSKHLLSILAAAVLVLAAGGGASAQGKKAMDCAKPENAKRSECAQPKENMRTNKGGADKGADRSGAVQDMNAAREKGGGKKN